jgi:uncharacterized membrane protein YGL010W
LHCNSLLLSTTQSLWWFCSRQFAKCTVYVTSWVVALNANHIMDRIRTAYICIQIVRQTPGHGVCTSKARRLVDELEVGGIFGISEGDVVLNLVGNLYKEFKAKLFIKRLTDSGKSV